MNPLPASSAPAPVKYAPLDWPRQTGAAEPLLREIETQLRRRRRKRARAAATATAVACVLGLALWLVPLVRNTQDVATPAAQRQQLALQDGSAVELNARTALHADFRYGRRSVRLERGEAFFSVAKDPGRPFLVATPAGTVRVTGTQFNVRVTAANQVEVTLLEGSVTIQSDGPQRGARGAKNNGGDSALRLVPGQRLALDGGRSDLRTLSAAELDGVIAWRQGRIVLQGLTLAEAAARFSDYHGRAISVAPAVAGLHLGGSCPIDDLKGFLRSLEEALRVQVQTAANGSVAIGHR